MEVYNIKNKLIYVIKNFFVNNYKMLIISIVIVVSIIICWNYWQLHNESNLEKSSEDFEKISSQLEKDSKQYLIAAEQFANKINNIYGVFTNIELTKIAVENNNIINAEKTLLKALEIAKLDDLKDLINLRLARVQLALNKTDKVLISLTNVKNKGWNTIIEDIRGDLLLKKGDIAGARSAYYKGIESRGSEIMKTILKIKINSLPN
ncbi:MAG: YfgM family protein [Arsenophonus sp.]